MHAQIHFSSVHPNIPSLPNSAIRVPVDVKRSGLSEIINHILGHATPESRVCYDFIMPKTGQILRTSLQQFMEAQGFSEEDNLFIEVIESIMPPRDLDAIPHEDWISSIDIVDLDGQCRILTGCYDGNAYLWDSKSAKEPIFKMSCSSGRAVKAVRFLDSDCDRCVFAGLDGIAHVWSIKEQKELFRLVGNDGSIECLAHIGGNVIFTGSQDGTIKMFDLTSTPSETSFASADISSKRQRKSENFPHLERIKSFKGHSGAVSCVQVTYTEIKIWDIESQTCTKTLNTSHACTALALCLESKTLASGHSDKYIRLWDVQTITSSSAQTGSLVRSKLKGHGSWITSISWSPKSSGSHLCSVSLDGTLKVWDTRSQTPIYTAQGDGKKLLSVYWHDSLFVCGGEGCQLRFLSNDLQQSR